MEDTKPTPPQAGPEPSSAPLKAAKALDAQYRFVGTEAHVAGIVLGRFGQKVRWTPAEYAERAQKVAVVPDSAFEAEFRSADEQLLLRRFAIPGSWAVAPPEFMEKVARLQEKWRQSRPVE